jgi:hypothetical protein
VLWDGPQLIILPIFSHNLAEMRDILVGFRNYFAELDNILAKTANDLAF